MRFRILFSNHCILARMARLRFLLKNLLGKTKLPDRLISAQHLVYGAPQLHGGEGVLIKNLPWVGQAKGGNHATHCLLRQTWGSNFPPVILDAPQPAALDERHHQQEEQQQSMASHATRANGCGWLPEHSTGSGTSTSHVCSKGSRPSTLVAQCENNSGVSKPADNIVCPISCGKMPPNCRWTTCL